jgi:hypothetical protein
MESKKPGLWKKLHRWPGLIISFVLLYYGITGIFMNHRATFSGLDISRKYLPKQYRYTNWNNAALKGNLNISRDSVLIYGNIGIWLTDNGFKNFKDMNSGFGKGSDKRKVADVHRSSDGNLYAATLLGLFAYDTKAEKWVMIGQEYGRIRFNAVESRGDTIYALSRSHLYYGISRGPATVLKEQQPDAPLGFENKVSLFSTVWQIHSGEIFGLPGKLFVDLLGLVTVFLSVTGIIWFFFPGWIKKRLAANKQADTLVKVGGWSLKWHNKVGEWTFVLLIILFFTGMFLRPPLLLAIANGKVSPVPYSELDQPNPWYDKLRDFHIDSRSGKILLSTSEGFYELGDIDHTPVPLQFQPPVSVMGITVFREENDGTYSVGSFSGLWSWIPGTPMVADLLTGLDPSEVSSGRPLPGQDISGELILPDGRRYVAKYSTGMEPAGEFPMLNEMPENVRKASGMSLWNLCLEIHTGRIFGGITGGFYILIVPLAGITGIIVVLSGYMVWRRKYKIKK